MSDVPIRREVVVRTIDELHRTKGLSVRCPSCQGEFPIRQARLFDATKTLPAQAVRYLDDAHAAIAEAKQDLAAQRADLKRRSFTSAAATGVGQVLEMIAPSLRGLPAEAQDCRVLLKPLDYLAFIGASAGKVEAIRFIEVKTGRQRLSPVQRAIKTAVENGALTLRVADHTIDSQSPP